jgi:anti-sigma factor RsiW
MMHPPLDEDIQELLDDRLDPEWRRHVEAFLGRNPELAEEIEALRRQDRDLRRLNEAVLAEPIPERLLATVRSATVPLAGGGSSAGASRGW